jgi:hypothetical protein
MCHRLLGWPSWSALLGNAKGTSKGSLDSLSYGCFHGGDELLGEGFDLSGDVRVGVGHLFSWVFLSRRNRIGQMAAGQQDRKGQGS